MPTLDALWDVTRTLLTVAVIGLAAFGMGRPILRAMKIVVDDSLGVAVWSLALGFVVSGFVLLVLGWVGWLYEPAVAAMTLAGGLSAVVEFACAYLGAGGGRMPIADSIPLLPALAPTKGPRIALSLCAGVMLLASLVAALAPPTSAALLSRLEIPKTALLNHAVHSAFHPAGNAMNLAQSWFLWALALEGPVAVNVLHWSLGLLAALATVMLGRNFVGTSSALVAGCLVLACPGVQFQMAVPLEDLALALFTTLALVATCQVLMELETTHWPVAAGLMLGAAVAINPAGLLFATAVAATWIYAVVVNVESRRQLTYAGRTALLATIVTAGPWLLAAGPGGFWSHPQTVQSMLAHVGPMLVAAGFGVAFARRLRGLSTILGCLALYLALAIIVRPDTTWWAPAVPVLAILAAWVLQEMVRLPPAANIAAAGVLGILALSGPAATLSMTVRSLAVATGRERRGEFLARYEPSYRAASLVNRLARPEDRLFCQNSGTFYFACSTTTGPELGPQNLFDPKAGSQRQLVDWARRAGFAYVLLSEPVAGDSSVARRLREDDARDSAPCDEDTGLGPIGEVIPILEYRFADDNNRCIRYRLLRLH